MVAPSGSRCAAVISHMPKGFLLLKPYMLAELPKNQGEQLQSPEAYVSYPGALGGIRHMEWTLHASLLTRAQRCMNDIGNYNAALPQSNIVCSYSSGMVRKAVVIIALTPVIQCRCCGSRCVCATRPSKLDACYSRSSALQPQLSPPSYHLLFAACFRRNPTYLPKCIPGAIL